MSWTDNRISNERQHCGVYRGVAQAKAFPAHDSTASRCHSMSPWSEIRSNNAVSGQDLLCWSGRLEAAHRSLSFSRGLRRVFGSVVEPVTASVVDTGQHAR